MYPFSISSPPAANFPVRGGAAPILIVSGAAGVGGGAGVGVGGGAGVGSGAGGGAAQAAIKGSAANTRIKQMLPANFNTLFFFIRSLL